MTDEIFQYIESCSEPEPPYLTELWRRANLRLAHGRMCSGHLQGRLLKMLVAMIRPQRVLELGTFVAYSALCMAEGLDDGASIDTIEANDELEPFIREALASSPYGHRVRVHIGDAATLPLQLAADGLYDLAFIDADKRQYPQYLEVCLKAVRPGGFIIADNTLWDGHVLENRHDGQTEGIRQFNQIVASHPRLEVVMLPMRDGLTLMRVKN